MRLQITHDELTEHVRANASAGRRRGTERAESERYVRRAPTGLNQEIIRCHELACGGQSLQWRNEDVGD
jgi:hypothetical protein